MRSLGTTTKYSFFDHTFIRHLNLSRHQTLRPGRANHSTYWPRLPPTMMLNDGAMTEHAVATAGRYVRRNSGSDGLWQVVTYADVVSVDRPVGRAHPD